MLVCLASSLDAGDVTNGELSVSLNYGLLSIQVDDMPLDQVLAEIGRQANTEVKLRGNLGNSNPQSFVDVPLQQGIERLSQPHHVLMLFDHDGKGGRRLQSILVEAATEDNLDQQVAPKLIATLTQAAKEPDGISEPPRYREIEQLDKGDRLAMLRNIAVGRDEMSAEMFVDVLVSDPDVTARRIAVTALSNLRGASAIAGLQRALDDANRSVRIQALRGLRLAMAKEVTPILLEVVASDSDPAVRRTAVELAAGLRAANAREVLELGALDPDLTVREAVNAGRRRR